jgi:hypothetical protein
MNFLRSLNTNAGGDAEQIFEKKSDAVHNWPSFAKQAGLRDANIKKIARFHL